MNQNFEKLVSQVLESKIPEEQAVDAARLRREVLKHGIDVQSFADELMKTAYTADELHDELSRLRMAALVKVLSIFGLCFVLRLMLLRFNRESSGDWLSTLVVVLSLLMVAALVGVFLRNIPGIWCVSPKGLTPSPQFWSWCEQLILDELAPARSKLESIPVTVELELSRKLEMRDGICRKLVRRQRLLAWTRREFAVTREKVRKIAILMPITELLLALVMALGLCALPMIDFIDSEELSGFEHQ